MNKKNINNNYNIEHIGTFNRAVFTFSNELIING